MNSTQWMIVVVVLVLIQAGLLLMAASLLNRSNDDADARRDDPTQERDVLSDIRREYRENELDHLGIDDELKDILF